MSIKEEELSDKEFEIVMRMTFGEKDLFNKARMNAIQDLKLKLQSVNSAISRNVYEMNAMRKRKITEKTVGYDPHRYEPIALYDDSKTDIEVIESLQKKREVLCHTIGKLQLSGYTEIEISPESLALQIVIMAALKTAEAEKDQKNKKKIKRGKRGAVGF